MSPRVARAGWLAAVVLLVAACSSSATGPSATVVPGSAVPSGDAAVRTSDEGQVTVSATWAGPSAAASFGLVLDTHTVDLDALDFADAVLRNDRGEQLNARPWSAPAGGHHRAGSLSFEGDTTAFLASARWVELVLYGIGDTPMRTLRWEIDA